jgi:hypothetical protein
LRGCMVSSRSTGYSVNGHMLCRLGFKKLFSVGNNRLQKISGNMFTRTENHRFHREATSTYYTLIDWLNDFFSRNVESLPNKDIYHLPDNWSKTEVFDAFKNETELRQEQEVTYSWFCRVWKSQFSRVRIPKRSRFSTCAPCTKFKAMRDKSTLMEERCKFLIHLVKVPALNR